MSRFLPNGYSDLLRQIVLFCGAYYLYRIVRGLVDGKADAAFRNARELVSVERGMHIFIEPTVHAWASSKTWIIDFASWMYINSHFAVTVFTLAWIYLFRNSAFYYVRNMFMVAMGLALVLYVLYPTAPPRFMPEWGFSDSVADFTGVKPTDGAANMLFNPFAAVPSMHVAFATMLGVPMFRMVKRLPYKIFWAFYPWLLVFVVISTANHWGADAFLGACTAGVGIAAAELMARLRPDCWAFKVEPWQGLREDAVPETVTA